MSPLLHDFDQYLSPFSWRYGSKEMRQIWSETNKRQLWRRVWLALATAQSEFGLVNSDQLADLQAHAAQIDIERALEIEAEIHHDLMAEIKTFAEQAPTGAPVIHLGATSMDIEDNAEALRLRDALRLALTRLDAALALLAARITETADIPVMAFTHIQPAEPTTLGYRFAFYAQDLLDDRRNLAAVTEQVLGKGFSGAVGNAASYIELLGPSGYAKFQAHMSQLLDLPFFDICSQTYPRKQDYFILAALAGLGASIYKFAFDLRVLQSPPFGEWSEPFSDKQVGSSAMPFKRNPIQSEKMDSLARLLSQYPTVAWNNAAHSLLERTLDDSANRRTILPEAFLIADELLLTLNKILKGMRLKQDEMRRNLNRYGPFAATERVMMAAAKAGGNRQDLHEILRELALNAWEAIQKGQPNPLQASIQSDPRLLALVPAEQLTELMDIEKYTGAAADRARAFAQKVLAATQAHQ